MGNSAGACHSLGLVPTDSETPRFGNAATCVPTALSNELRAVLVKEHLPYTLLRESWLKTFLYSSTLKTSTMGATRLSTTNSRHSTQHNVVCSASILKSWSSTFFSGRPHPVFEPCTNSYEDANIITSICPEKEPLCTHRASTLCQWRFQHPITHVVHIASCHRWHRSTFRSTHGRPWTGRPSAGTAPHLKAGHRGLLPVALRGHGGFADLPAAQRLSIRHHEDLPARRVTQGPGDSAALGSVVRGLDRSGRRSEKHPGRVTRCFVTTRHYIFIGGPWPWMFYHIMKEIAWITHATCPPSSVVRVSPHGELWPPGSSLAKPSPRQRQHRPDWRGVKSTTGLPSPNMLVPEVTKGWV